VLSHKRIGVRECNAEEARVRTLLVGSVENKIEFFSERPFRSTLCWRNDSTAVERIKERPSLQTCRIFSPLLCVTVSRERKNHVEKHTGSKEKKIKFFKSSRFLIFSLLSRFKSEIIEKNV
jgi:hypothetical protein